MRPKKKIVIVGAGPGGLTAGMILAHRGCEVAIYEKDAYVGGRNQPLQLGVYTFDTGPTFLMLDFILRDMFTEAGRKLDEYLTLKKLDPLYRLQFEDLAMYPTNDRERLRTHIKSLFPGDEKGIDAFFAYEKKRFEHLFPCLQKDYSSFRSFLDPIFIGAARYFSLGKSLFQNLGRYFSHDQLKLAFTFQSKYLGMSPWKCPAIFTMLSYMEYAYGVYHVMGGLHKISDAMARIIREEGGTIHLKKPVREVLTKGRSVTGVLLEDGSTVTADSVIINADFSYAMTHLFRPGIIRKYRAAALEKKQYSCSTFMMYLGLKKMYDLNHHTIMFARDYKENVRRISENEKLSDDFSFYIQNAAVTDPSVAPPGKSTWYVLVPVPNNRSKIAWEREKKVFRDTVVKRIIERTGFTDLESSIEEEKIITPHEWEHTYNVYIAAEFNLAHTISQMLYFRPHNKFEELTNCYLVGGGTHPGSGLPTIYESGRITSNLICKQYGIPFTNPRSLRDLIPYAASQE